jgi:hypothetical protein
VHAFNPSTWEAEAGEFLSLRPAWSTEWDPGQPGLYRETLSQKKNLFKWVHCSYLQTHQMRELDPITDGCEPSCGCWELSSWPQEEHWVLLSAEPSLQPFFVCLFVCLFVFWDRVSLYSCVCPGTHFVDQAGLELRNPLASASRVLELKAWATIPGLILFLVSGIVVVLALLELPI